MAFSLSTVFDRLYLGIAELDGDDRVLSWNTWLEQETGIAAGYALDRRLDGIWPALAAHPPALSVGDHRCLELSCPLPGGERRRRFHLQVSASPEPGRRLLQFLLDTPSATTAVRRGPDSVERERARDSETLFQTALDNAPIGIAVIGLDGRWQQVNPALCELLGYDAAELLQMKFQDLTHPDDLALDLTMVEKLLSGQLRNYQLEKRYLRKNGESLWVLLSATLIRDQDNKPRHFISHVLDITARRRYEDMLKTNEERWQFALDSTATGAWDWDLHSDELLVSRNWKTMHGYRNHQIGNRFSEWTEKIHPDDKAKARAAVIAHLRGDTPAYETEFRVRTAKGQWRWFLSRGKVLSRDADGRAQRMIGIQSDIHKQKRDAELLRQTLALQQVLLNSTDYGILSTDNAGNILIFNRGAERLFEREARRVVGNERLDSLFSTAELERYADELKDRLDAPPQSGFEVLSALARRDLSDEREWTLIRADGSRRCLNLSVTAIRDHEGERIGFLAIASDITERKRIERMKTEFVSTVSHELRTPLTSIRGALGLLLGTLGERLEAPQRELLQIGLRNVERLSLLVNDILDFEKIRSGKLRLDRHPQKLLPIIRQSIEAVQGFANQYDVQLRLTENPGQEYWQASVDEARLIQVLTNLLSNAAKFSPRGGEVVIAMTRDNGGIDISVKDRGPGIPADFRERIFQPFSQADSSDSRVKGGTGLGLAISRSLVEQMSGRLDYESAPGSGSCFHIWLRDLAI